MDSATCDTILTALTPAKINLALLIHGRREDGYHTLTSLVTGVELFDEITFAPAECPGVRLACDDPAVPEDERNLVVQAAVSLAERVGWVRGVTIKLRKRIPVGAGLGGGSSDCATALRTLNRLWDAGLSDVELGQLGAQLGSDVPLFFHLPSAVITGRGEQVQPVTLRWSGWVVLALGGWTVSTRAVYANWREADRSGRDYNVVDALPACGTAAELSPLLVNELEPAVFRTVPAVRQFHAGLVEWTGHAWRISGAGSTAFALFDRETEARGMAATVREKKLTQRVVVVRNLSR